MLFAASCGVQNRAWGLRHASTSLGRGSYLESDAACGAWGESKVAGATSTVWRACLTGRPVCEQDELKQQAAWRAVEYVQSGMVVGLGTGSTAAYAVDRIGQLLKEDALRDIVAVPTSVRTYEQAKGASARAASTRCRLCSVLLPGQAGAVRLCRGLRL